MALRLLNAIIHDVRNPPATAASAAALAAACLTSKPPPAAADAKPTTKPVAADSKPPPASSLPAGSLPPTRALWLEDTYLFQTDALVLAVERTADGWAVALDQTCFHPQGGGQPADSGVIRPRGGGAAFEVNTMVRLDKGSGVVWHEGPGIEAQPPLAVGASAACEVDPANRLAAARLHSGGHLLDAAMRAAGCELVPSKGYHFSPGSYVEYSGKLSAEERDALLPRLQLEVNRLISEGGATAVATGEGGMRIVTLGGVSCPCGGTHVRNAAEIGALTVEGIKGKGKVTRVSYSLE